MDGEKDTNDLSKYVFILLNYRSSVIEIRNLKEDLTSIVHGTVVFVEK